MRYPKAQSMVWRFLNVGELRETHLRLRRTCTYDAPLSYESFVNIPAGLLAKYPKQQSLHVYTKSSLCLTVLLHVCEVRGLGLGIIKKTNSTPSHMVYGVTKRFPLYIHVIIFLEWFFGLINIIITI